MVSENPKYILRFFFDAGSGTCFWSGNDQANSKFGYPVEIDNLPIDQCLSDRFHSLIKRFDESINWDYPPGDSPWSEDEKAEFNAISAKLLIELKEIIGSQFKIVDESRVIE